MLKNNKETYVTVCHFFTKKILCGFSHAEGYFARRRKEGLPGVLGNKGTLANFWEQGNKIRKIIVRKHLENVWEHGNIGQF